MFRAVLMYHLPPFTHHLVAVTPSRNLKQRDGRNGNRPAAALHVPMAVL